MSGGRQNTKLPLCQTIPDDNSVSKEKIDEYELKSVMKVIDKIRAEAYNIGLNLRMSTDTLDPIVRLHKIGTHRCAISIMDTWLRGNYDPNGLPYTLHKEKEHQCPSWWDLVWAVCQPSAGENLRLAREIAKKYKTYEEPEDTSAFSNASSTLFDEEDGVTLVTDLDDVWHRWYEIGVALGIPTNKLDPVLEKGNSRLCFQEMISIWIHLGQREEESKRPCWKLLLIAVAASYGGQNPRLARDLLEKHKDNSERAQDATTGQAEAQSKGGRIRGEGDETDPGDTPIDTPAPHQNAPPSSDTVELLQPDVMHPTEDRDKRKSSEQKGQGQEWGKRAVVTFLTVVVVAVLAVPVYNILQAVSKDHTSHQDTISSSQAKPQPTGHGEHWSEMEPQEDMLYQFKYRNSEGKEQNFYLIEKIQTKCKKLGTILGIEHNKLDGFDNKYHGDMESLCKTVLHTWITEAPEKYPVTWGGLLEALRNAQLVGVARKLETALEFFYQ